MAQSFIEAQQSLSTISSGDRRKTREGIARNSWVLPIIEQARGLRVNYLTDHPRLTSFHNSIRSTPPGNLRKRTRNLGHGIARVMSPTDVRPKPTPRCKENLKENLKENPTTKLNLSQSVSYFTVPPR